MITERHNVACRLIMKAICKGFQAGCLVQSDAGSTNRMAQQNLQIPEMQIVGHYPAGFLMLVYLPEIYSPLVILMPFWSLPYLHKNSKNSNRQSLHIAPGVMPKTTQWRCTQSSRAQCQQEGNIAC